MKKVLFVLLLLVVTLSIIPLFLPKTMHVEEEYIYDAPVENVYHHFNDLRKFTKFDALTQMDSTLQLEFSTPSYGNEATYSWSSENAETDEGRVTIKETKVNDFILYDLDINENQKSTAEVIFQRMDDDKTRVVWSFDSDEASYPFQVYNIIMKGTVKENLRKGLVQLDYILKNPAKLDYPNKDVQKGGFQIIEQERKSLFGVMQQSGTEDEELRMAISETFGFIKSYLIDANNLTAEEIGDPIIIWKQYDAENDNALFYCGYIIDKKVPEVDDLEYVEIPGGKFLTSFHHGPFNTLDISQNRMRQFADVQNLEVSIDTYNAFKNYDNSFDKADLNTQIFIPIIH